MGGHCPGRLAASHRHDDAGANGRARSSGWYSLNATVARSSSNTRGARERLVHNRLLIDESYSNDSTAPWCLVPNTVDAVASNEKQPTLAAHTALERIGAHSSKIGSSAALHFALFGHGWGHKVPILACLSLPQQIKALTIHANALR